MYRQIAAKIAAVILGLSLGLTATAAFAGYAIDGRKSDSTNVDGTLAGITGNSFNQNNNQCVLYGIVTPNWTSPAQVEVGLVRCTATQLDGTCSGGYAFAERFSGSTYVCNQGNSFTNGTSYTGNISRTSSTMMSGTIHGATVNQGGYSTTDQVPALAWAEVTQGPAGGNCPASAANGSFSGWNKLITGSGWSLINNSTQYHYQSGSLGPCWSVSAVSSSGGFSVS